MNVDPVKGGFQHFIKTDICLEWSMTSDPLLKEIYCRVSILRTPTGRLFGNYLWRHICIMNK